MRGASLLRDLKRSRTGVFLFAFVLWLLTFPLYSAAQQRDNKTTDKDWRATLQKMAKAYEKEPAPLSKQDNPPKNNVTQSDTQKSNISPGGTDGSSSDLPVASNSVTSDGDSLNSVSSESQQEEPQSTEIGTATENLVTATENPIEQDAPQENTVRGSEERPEEPQDDVDPSESDADLFAEPDPFRQLDNSPAQAEFSPTIEDGDELVRRFAVGEELVLSVVAAGYPMGEIFAMTTAKGYQIGLLELSQILNFAIDLSDDNRSASGWFISPINTFTLDVDDSGALTAQVIDQVYTLGPEEYETDFDLMLEADDLSRWFDLTIEVDESRLVVDITSSRPFPFEAANKRRQQQLRGSYQAARSVLPPIENGYQLFSPPLLDIQTALRKNNNNSTYNYSIVSRQDVAFLSSNLFLAGGKEDELRDARLTFTRESPEGGMFGKLDLTEISFGDVLPINVGTGTTAGFGRGISFSNIKEQLADNRQVNFTGIIQEGWDVELYRNGILLDNDFDIQSGRYEFTDVELLFGANDFELVFYGPQGQIERRNETYIVDRNALQADQSSLRFSMVDSNESLLGVTESGGNFEDKGINAGVVYERGITNWWTVGASAAWFSPDVGEDEEAVSIRQNFSLGQYGILNTVVSRNSNELRNYLANYRTRIGETSLALSWTQNEAQVIEANAIRIKNTSNVSLNFSGRLFEGSKYPLGYENILSRSRNANGINSDSFRQSLSMVTNFGSFNHAFRGNRTSGAIDDDWLISGTFGYRNRFGRVFTRVFGDVAYRPDSELQTFGANFNYPISKTLSSEFRYTYNVEQSTSNYGARINWLAENVTLSGFASYSDSDNWNVNISARFGLGINNQNEAQLISSRPISQAGALAVRVYEDLDLDKEYDPGEPLLDNVQVTAPQVARNDVTKDGSAFLTRLPNNRRTDILVDPTTLPDYSYMRLDEGFSVTGRRGLLQFAEIPFTRGGELDGTVYFVNKEGEEEPLAFVGLNLVNEEGDIVATTRSEFDGFYLFEKVLPGDYRLFIDERILRQRNAIQEVTKKLNISNQGDLFTEVDLVLRELNQAKGYIATVGNFKSLTLLKVYFGLMQKRVPPELVNDVFYLSPDGDFDYRIAISYSEEELRAERSCEYAAQYQVDCEVQYVEFGY